MGEFKKYSFPGTCSVCGKETDVVVCASSGVVYTHSEWTWYF